MILRRETQVAATFKKVAAIFLLGLFSSCSQATPRVAGFTDAAPFKPSASVEISYPQSPFNPLVKEVFSSTNSGGKHYVYSLDIGDEALLARVHLIRQAQKSIDIQTFIWSNDETGRFVINELIAAAKRGVKVRVINDQWRLEDPTHLAAYLDDAHPNIEVKHYNPAAQRLTPGALGLLKELTFNFRKLNQRMHNKVFIVDGRFAITGGRNYENDYYDRGQARNFKDRDILAIGPVVQLIAKSFEEYWNFPLSIPSEELIDVGSLIRDQSYKRYDKPEDMSFAELFAGLDRDVSDSAIIKNVFADRMFAVAQVDFVADPPGKNKGGLSGGSVTAKALISFLNQARGQIIVQTPYLVLDKKSVKAIRKLRRNNADLDILISSNSLAATDSIYAYAFAFKQSKLFIEDLRFRIFEFKPVPNDIKLMMPRYEPRGEAPDYSVDQLAKDGGFEKRVMNLIPKVTEAVANSIFPEEKGVAVEGRHLCIHAKTFIVDETHTWIGSFNVDPRSANLNTEVALIVEDRAFTQNVKADIARDMKPQNAWAVGKRQDIVLVSQLRSLASKAFDRVPLIDIWPFRHTSNFELKEGALEVPFYHEDFYNNYISVGSFPGVDLSLKEIQIRLLKTLGGFAEPII